MNRGLSVLTQLWQRYRPRRLTLKVARFIGADVWVDYLWFFPIPILAVRAALGVRDWRPAAWELIALFIVCTLHGLAWAGCATAAGVRPPWIRITPAGHVPYDGPLLFSRRVALVNALTPIIHLFLLGLVVAGLFLPVFGLGGLPLLAHLAVALLVLIGVNLVPLRPFAMGWLVYATLPRLVRFHRLQTFIAIFLATAALITGFVFMGEMIAVGLVALTIGATAMQTASESSKWNVARSRDGVMPEVRCPVCGTHPIWRPTGECKHCGEHLNAFMTEGNCWRCGTAVEGVKCRTCDRLSPVDAWRTDEPDQRSDAPNTSLRSA